MRIGIAYSNRYDIEEYSQDEKRRYFIACEGEKTEYLYMRGIIAWGDEIGIDPLVEIIPIQHTVDTGSNPLRIYNEAVKTVEDRLEPNNGDKLCIIADRDFHSFKENQYDELLKAVNEGRVKLFISNPNFEFWLLLHYDDCKSLDKNKLLENKKIGNRTYTEICLKEILQGSYSKTSIKFEKNYKDRIHIAIENSKKYETNVNKLKSSLGTNMGLLIEELCKK